MTDRDQFKCLVLGARAAYSLSINQPDPYWAGYHKAEADQMQRRAIHVALCNGAILSDTLPKAELFPGQFQEPPEP